MTPWIATFTRRWHTHSHLSQTNDPVGYHSGRMGVLALDFFGTDANLLAACLTHDLGEYVTGDAPFGSPVKDHVAEDDARLNMGMYYPCDERVKFLDLLDIYLWARHHAPHVVKEPDWRKQLLTLIEMADSLGVSEKLGEYI
jgi:5'-deoxynucleotidase YfbR-like HD superfamily hydrolase